MASLPWPRRALAALIILWNVGWLGNLHAATCNSVFSTGVQVHSSTGSISLDYHARIKGGVTQVVTPNLVDNSGWHSCQSAPCTKTSTFNSPVNVTVPASTGANGAITVPFRGAVTRAAGQYAAVSVGQEGTLTFSTTNGNYYTSGFTTGYKSQLTFAPGDYYINGNLAIGQENSLLLSGTGAVRLFVNGNVTLPFKVATANTDPARFLIYAKNNITLGNEVDIKGFLYSQTGSVTMQFRATVDGGVAAATGIFLDNEAEVTYNPAAATANLGDLCDSTAPPPSIDSFNFNLGAGTASTCASRAITITARDASNATLTGYTGTIALTTSTGRGTWAKTGTATDANGTLTPGADNGQASYTFTAADAGDIVLNLSNQRAQTLTITANDAAAGKSSISAGLTFSENAFVITIPDAFGDDLIAGRSHTFTASLWRRDPTTGICGLATAYNITGVKMWLSRDAADPGGTGPTATNTSGVTSSAVLPNSEPAANNINLNFSGGEANFTLLASDVGKYSLNIRDASGSFASSAISGSSAAAYVARPFGFAISVTGNPAATDANGGKFKIAGEAFSATVRAVGWSSADDDNPTDGIADGHQDALPGNNDSLADNAALPSFGREPTAERVLLGAALFAPGGDNPGLSGSTTNLTGFLNGSATATDLVFNNVGVIEISGVVTDGDYLSAGSTRTNKMATRSGYVGRFVPSHFSLTNPAVEPACTPMIDHSYLGQDFTARAILTARTLSDSVATNYRDTFVKLQPATAFYAVDLTAPTLLTPRLTHQSGSTYSWSGGVLTATTTLAVGRTTAPDGPFINTHIGFRPVDSDGVALAPLHINLNTDNSGGADAADLGTTQLRYGRLRLEDAYGPETASLPVRFLTEYWSDGWVQNLDDSCTTIALTDITYPGGAISTPANRTVAVGGGSSTGQYAGLTASAVTFTGGTAGQSFTAPGAGNTGSIAVDVNLTSYPWLRFDWNGDGDYADSQLPRAQFTFGNYRGHDRVLYWMEIGR